MEKNDNEFPLQQQSTPMQPPVYDFDINEEEDTSTWGRIVSFCQYHPFMTASFCLSLVFFCLITIVSILAQLKFSSFILLNIFASAYFSLICFICSLHSIKLSLAARSGYLNIIDEELRKGVNINVTSLMEKSTPIFQAVQSGRLRTVKYLVERGADINSFDFAGLTTLHHAKTAKMADYLLFLGVKVDETRVVSKMTPLHIAIVLRLFDVALLLVERGADVNLETSTGMSALSLALVCSSPFFKRSDVLIEAILKAGADTRHGFTHCCIYYESCESYAKTWNSSTINSMIAKINPYTSNI